MNENQAKERRNVTFFFGSGADTDCCGLPSGATFSEFLFTGEYLNERKQLLGKEFGRFQLVHQNSRTVYIQSILENYEKAKQVFTNEDSCFFDVCRQYYENEYKDKSEKKEIKEKIDEKCEKWYRLLKQSDPIEDLNQDEISNNQEEIANFFYQNGVFFDSLDEKFNGLRNFKTSKKGKRVMSSYATVFILMLKRLYKIDKSFSWDYKSVFEFLNQKPEYNITPKKENYYQLLSRQKELLTAEKEYCNVVTTNYTSLAEEIIGADVIYLHGKLTWFEDLKHFMIYDCMDSEQRKAAEQNQEHLIPFLMIPSGVKPLIATRQIEEFHKFIEALNVSERLIIVGYRFNSEDNHVNAIIGNWMRENRHRQMIYLNFKNEVDIKQFGWLEDFLIVNAEEVSEQIFDFKNRIINISVDEKNCDSVFQKCLEFFSKDKK